MLVTIIGTCGRCRCRDMTMSSPCIGCSCSPGPMSIAVMPESRQPRSSTRSTIGNTLSCKGIAWNTASFASRLYMRRVACPSAAVPLGSTCSSRSNRRIAVRSSTTSSGSIAPSTIV